jgi:hypothetical protein
MGIFNRVKDSILQELGFEATKARFHEGIVVRIIGTAHAL